MKSIVTALLLTLSAFGLSCTNKVRTETMTLPGGKEIEVRQTIPIVVGDGTRVLMMTYITSTPVSEVEALKKEAEVIWPWYKDIVESRGFEAAGIQAANVVEESFMYNETQNYTLVYQKKNGAWERL